VQYVVTMRNILRSFAVYLSASAALLLLACSSVAASEALLTDRTHQVWTMDSGLPANEVHDIVETRDGYIWVATPDGIARFDGSRFQKLTTENAPGLVSNNVMHILEDADAHLICEANGRVYSYDGRRFTDITPPLSDKDDLITQILLDNHRHLIMAFQNSLYRYVNGITTKIAALDGLFRGPISGWSAFTVARDGTFYIGGRSGAVYHLVGNTAVDMDPHKRLGNAWIVSFGEDRWGTVWICANRSIWRVTGRDIVLTVGEVEHILRQEAFLRDIDSCTFTENGELLMSYYGKVYHLDREGQIKLYSQQLPGICSNVEYRDRNNNRWFESLSTLGTAAATITLVRGGRLDPYGVANGLPGSVRCALLDTRGNVWIGTQAGLVLLKTTKCHTFDEHDGLRSHVIRSIVWDRHGSLWVVTEDHDVYVMRNGRFTPVDFRLPKDRLINSLFWDSHGRLFVVGDDRPYQIEGGRFIEWNAKLVKRSFGCSFVTEDKRGGLWFAYNNDLVVYRDGKVTRYDSAKDMPAGWNCFFSSYAAPDGTMWFGSSDKLFHVQDGKVQWWGHESGLPSVPVIDIHGDRDGALWLATWGAGIARFKDGHFTQITATEGLASDAVYNIHTGADDTLWMGSSRGIFQVHRKDLNAIADGRRSLLQCTLFDSSDGAAGGQCYGGMQPTVAQDRNGTLWYATYGGVVRVGQGNPPPEQSPVYITSIVANGRSVPTSAPARIAPGEGSLQIGYTALAFRQPDKLTFRYQLGGFDKDWKEVTSQQRVATYTNLPPGHYIFRVAVRNADGQWQPAVAQVSIEFLPTVYQTVWFRALCVLLGTLLLAGLVRIRFAQLRRRNEELEIKIAERTYDLSQAMVQLENLATTDGLTGLKNHRAFQEQFDHEFGKASRYHAPLSVVLLDVDKFKQYNDTYGHPAGDTVLRSVSRILLDYAREADFVARYGGEEFVIILPNTDTAGSIAVAERFREAVEQAEWPSREITASFGVATTTLQSISTTDLLVQADQALYVSKEQGRNRVTHAGTPSESPRV